MVLGDIGEVVSLKLKEEKAVNKKLFLTILENIGFLTHHGLPFRNL